MVGGVSRGVLRLMAEDTHLRLASLSPSNKVISHCSCSLPSLGYMTNAMPPEVEEAWQDHLNSLEAEFGADALARLRTSRFGPGQGELANQDPTLAYVPGLRAIPWWDPAAPELEPFTSWLDQHCDAILQETLACSRTEDDHFDPYPHLTITGAQADGWDVIFHCRSGTLIPENLDRFPTLATMLQRFPRAGTFECLISRLSPGAHLLPHCGTNNVVLTVQLPLVVPDGNTALRVIDDTRRWEPGRTAVFDDSFEHEAWNRTDEDRLLLLVSFFHPDLTDVECNIIRDIMPVMALAYEELIANAAT